jgi:hypothetical protein
VNIQFTKITNLALYRTLKKAHSEFQSQSQLVKLTLQEVMGIIIEDHGVENMIQSIQDIIEEVKYLQLLRSDQILFFEMGSVQLVTETHSVLYEMASTECAIEIDWRYKEYQIQKSKLARDIFNQVYFKQIEDFFISFEQLFCSALFSFIKRANIILNKHPKLLISFLFQAENIESIQNRIVFFHKPENTRTRCKQRSFGEKLFSWFIQCLSSLFEEKDAWRMTSGR